jgi:aldehyde oxidoreductase
MHGIGFALRENIRMSQNTRISPACGFSYAKDVPDNIEVIHVKTAERQPGRLCRRGGGLPVQQPHVRHQRHRQRCGVRIYELPATPDKVKAGLDKLAAGEQVLPPDKFFLGSDVIEEIENLLANPI